MKTSHKHRLQGFTLIELLVVITIIAILASVAVPVYNVITARANKTKALAHAKQIHIAIANYAIDNDGIFPRAETSANEAFRQLFTRKFQDERIFYVAGCAWHDGLPSGQTKPDNDVGDPPEFEQGLSVGENHWAYVSGLNNGSKGALPVIADGFGDTPGTYAELPNKKGGVWEGEDAIIIRADGSGKQEKLGADLKVYEQKRGQKVDMFSDEYGIDSGGVLNPQ